MAFGFVVRCSAKDGSTLFVSRSGRSYTDDIDDSHVYESKLSAEKKCFHLQSNGHPEADIIDVEVTITERYGMPEEARMGSLGSLLDEID